jgi:hypothetical protein
MPSAPATSQSLGGRKLPPETFASFREKYTDESVSPRLSFPKCPRKTGEFRPKEWEVSLGAEGVVDADGLEHPTRMLLVS